MAGVDVHVARIGSDVVAKGESVPPAAPRLIAGRQFASIVVIEEALIGAVPAAALDGIGTHISKCGKAGSQDQEARIEGIGPPNVGRCAQGGCEAEEVGDGSEDEHVGIEEDNLVVARQTPGVQFGERLSIEIRPT